MKEKGLNPRENECNTSPRGSSLFGYAQTTAELTTLFFLAQTLKGKHRGEKSLDPQGGGRHTKKGVEQSKKGNAETTSKEGEREDTTRDETRIMRFLGSGEEDTTAFPSHEELVEKQRQRALEETFRPRFRPDEE